MKKIIILLAALGIAVSCMDNLYPGTIGPDRLLAMNADLHSTDTLHTVRLYFSGHYSIEYVEDATVSIYVNGELMDTTSEDMPDDDVSYRGDYAVYQLNARFSEGDRVRIVAEKDDYHIEAEETVLPCPPVSDTDYEIVVEQDLMSDKMEKYIDFNIGIKDDSAGLDYYAAEVLLKKKCVRDNDGKVMAFFHDRLKLDVSKDPLLTSNFPSSLAPIGSSSYNRYEEFLFCCFTNDSFINSSYSLYLRTLYYYNLLSPHHNMSSGEQYTMDLCFEIRYSRVPRSAYSAYMNSYLNGGALNLFIMFGQHHEYQSNVTGGTGCVNIWSSTVETIDLGTFHYDIYSRDVGL